MKRSPIARLALVILLISVIAIGAVPGYLKGKSSWRDMPPVENLKQLRKLRQTGLNITGWQTLEQREINLGGNKWLLQILEKEGNNPLTLLLLPQSDGRKQPAVEWLDIYGMENWQTDAHTRLKFKVEEVAVEADFFRAWNRQQTFFVVQWYAWPNGGHPDPLKWFWADRIAQLKGDRVPWIAVCLKMEIDPFQDTSLARDRAESLAKIVQTRLRSGPFSDQ